MVAGRDLTVSKALLTAVWIVRPLATCCSTNGAPFWALAKTKLLKAFRGASLILETVLVSKRSELTNRSNFTCLWADLASQDGHLVLE